MSNNCVSGKDICHMWQAHYKDLLNSVVSFKSKECVERKLKSIADSLIVFTPVDIFKALKNTMTGKACGVDGLAVEHFIYANPSYLVCKDDQSEPLCICLATIILSYMTDS